jgi:glutamate dehydrogenase
MDTVDLMDVAKRRGLVPGVLYKTLLGLTEEGLFTARCVHAAAGILLAELGLPAYFFRHLSPAALRAILRTVAANVQEENGRFRLRSEVSEVPFDMEGGVQVRIATGRNRDRMEAVLNAAMVERRVEYYGGRASGYYTYVIRSEPCRAVAELKAGESPFAFNQAVGGSAVVPLATRRRYEAFLKAATADVTPLVRVSAARATRETRVMFRDDFQRSALPVIRHLLEELRLPLNRAYWEPWRHPAGRVESVCSLYLDGTPAPAALARFLAGLRGLLAAPESELDTPYVGGALTLEEYLFATTAAAAVHTFVYKDAPADAAILSGLGDPALRDAFARRVFESNRAEFTRRGILEMVRQQPGFVKELYRLFDRRFNPAQRRRLSAAALRREVEKFQQRVAIALVDDRTGADLYQFMGKCLIHTLKTNFYQERKRAFAFRLAPALLDPLVFPGQVHGVFFVAGFHAIGTHLRAEDVARGGVRLIRVTPGNYEAELDAMLLLNYALGPVAQRLKHKDIAESGAKGVIVPHPPYAGDGLAAILDFADGILDLMLPNPAVVDHLGRPEVIFFGPDEGTAPFMDAVAQRARDRGYRHWRTITTGKSIGIPHDTYGRLADGRVFGLLDRGARGTELQIAGAPVLTTTTMDAIRRRIGGHITLSGMTTTGIMTCLRTVFDHLAMKEEDTPLMMTGGPDGDLGANQIQSYRGPIGLLVDGGSVLFDPDGLDRDELLKLAFARHTQPRLNSLAFPPAALGPRGFRIPRAPGPCTLPDGTVIADGAWFHRNALTDPAMGRLVAAANIRAFVPCGGLKDTVNADNARRFLANFPALRVIVEGANVFFDDTAREIIARDRKILQIRDSSANKGGVTSSSIAEVLTAFLLGDQYEAVLVRDARAKAALVEAVFERIAHNAAAETRMLLALGRQTGTPLHRLSVQTSEQLLEVQQRLYAGLDVIAQDRQVVEAAFRAYVPTLLVKRLGMPRILRTFARPELRAYGDAILTKAIAALALYRHAAAWDVFLDRLTRDFAGTVRALCLMPAANQMEDTSRRD